MKLTIKPKNRRQFLKKFSLSAAAIALTPNISFSNSTINDKISIGFSNTPLETILKISRSFSQSQEFIVKESHLKTDLLYIHSGIYNDFEKLEKEQFVNTILIVNQENFDANSLHNLKNLCNKNKTFLLVIEENLSKSTKIVFSKATLYEPQLCDLTKIDTIVKSISFLNQLTQQNLFFTVNQSLILNNTII